MHQLDHMSEDPRIGFWEDPVAEVEHMAWVVVISGQHIGDRGVDDFKRFKTDCWIEVALQDDVGTKQTAGLVERGLPTHTDNVGTRGRK